MDFLFRGSVRCANELARVTMMLLLAFVRSTDGRGLAASSSAARVQGGFFYRTGHAGSMSARIYADRDLRPRPSQARVAGRLSGWNRRASWRKALAIWVRDAVRDTLPHDRGQRVPP